MEGSNYMNHDNGRQEVNLYDKFVLKILPILETRDVFFSEAFDDVGPLIHVPVHSLRMQHVTGYC